MSSYMSIKSSLYCIMVMSSIMVISSSNWFMMWLALELNLFSFIPLMFNNYSPQESEASMNYFLSQALGSITLLMSSSSLMIMFMYKEVMLTMLMLSLLLKMGLAPCYFWFPMTMEMMNWPICILLSTWQKIAPLCIMLFIVSPKINSMLLMIISSINAIMGGLMGLSQLSLKKIMAYSSITHMGWLMSTLSIHMPCLSMTYFIIYCILSIPLFIMFMNLKMMYITDLWNKNNMKINSMIISVMLLSLSGIPPMTGFIPKLIIMNMLIKNSMLFLMFLIIGSLMNLYFYLNIIMNMIFNNNNNNNFYINSDNIYYILFLLSMTIMSPVLIML